MAGTPKTEGAGLHVGRDAQGTPVRLKPSSLRTHGVIVGMTGSGKTGLCLVMLEELVRAGVPVIAIDPKGDLGNLGLVFPDLDAGSFAPWADGADPAQLAATWREGLAGWGYGPEQVAQLRDTLELSLYTPGSEAGISVDLLGMLAAPPTDQLTDLEGLRGLIRDTVSGLLGLVGRSTDPVRDPAHVVLSHILERAWTAGEDLDLEALITRLVDPPFEKVGVFPTDRFFPPDDRMDLAMGLNGVIASPAFAAWTQGEALDIQQMLTVGPDGRVPVNVFSIAHLPESERHFFVALLLGRVLAWSRSQPGTERLRAVVFFDEVAGYLPPHPQNPASKSPLLMLMKQARAMGLGVVLSTQNPVDVDYKALSNAGLWAIGRLRTEQDRKRMLKGLDPSLDAAVQGLGKREFLLARAKGGHTVFSTRWAMCYLRGPFTRQEISSLRAPRAGLIEAAAPPRPATPPPPVREHLADQPPPLPEVDQVFLDPRVAHGARLGPSLQALSEPPRDDGRIRWVPALWAELSLHFQASRQGFSLDHQEHRLVFPLPTDSLPASGHLRLELEASDLLGSPPQGAIYEELPAWLDEEREWKAAQKQLVDAVYRSETRGMFVHAGLRLYGRGGERREDFEARCTKALEDRVDAAVAKLRERTEKKVDTLEGRIRARERKLEDYEGAVSSRKAEEAVNVGETVLSFFTGRRKSLSTAMTRRSRTREAQDRVERTADEIAELKEQVSELLQEVKEQVQDIRQAELDKLAEIEEREVRLRKQDIQLRRFGLLWVPVTRRI